MDPLSVASGAIACIQIASKIISACKSYITTVKESHNDVRNILIEVGGVKCTLEVLELLGTQDHDGELPIILTRLEKMGNPVEGCRQALAALEKMLPIDVIDCPTEGKRRKLDVYTKMAWPLKRTRVQTLLEDIGRHKTTISLALTAETV
jgi:hypothetical protein